MTLTSFQQLFQLIYIILNSANFSNFIFFFSTNINQVLFEFNKFLIVYITNNLELSYLLLCCQNVCSHCQEDCHFVILISIQNILITAKLVNCRLRKSWNLLLQSLFLEDNNRPQMAHQSVTQRRIYKSISLIVYLYIVLHAAAALRISESLKKRRMYYKDLKEREMSLMKVGMMIWLLFLVAASNSVARIQYSQNQFKLFLRSLSIQSNLKLFSSPNPIIQFIFADPKNINYQITQQSKLYQSLEQKALKVGFQLYLRLRQIQQNYNKNIVKRTNKMMKTSKKKELILTAEQKKKYVPIQTLEQQQEQYYSGRKKIDQQQKKQQHLDPPTIKIRKNWETPAGSEQKIKSRLAHWMDHSQLTSDYEIHTEQINFFGQKQKCKEIQQDSLYMQMVNQIKTQKQKIDKITHIIDFLNARNQQVKLKYQQMVGKLQRVQFQYQQKLKSSYQLIKQLEERCSLVSNYQSRKGQITQTKLYENHQITKITFGPDRSKDESFKQIENLLLTEELLNFQNQILYIQQYLRRQAQVGSSRLQESRHLAACVEDDFINFRINNNKYKLQRAEGKITKQQMHQIIHNLMSQVVKWQNYASTLKRHWTECIHEIEKLSEVKKARFKTRQFTNEQLVEFVKKEVKDIIIGQAKAKKIESEELKKIIQQLFLRLQTQTSIKREDSDLLSLKPKNKEELQPFCKINTFN